MKRQPHIPNEDRPSNIQRAAESRPTRVPINGQRDVLSVRGMEPGFHYCWVNEDRVDRYLDGAYEFVTHDVVVGDKKVDAASQQGGKVSKRVGVGADGVPLVAYLMRIDEQYYNNDMNELHNRINEREESLRVNFSKPNDNGQYGKVEVTKGR